MKKDLNDIDKKQPFNVPEGYFNSLEDRIMARVEEEQKKEANPKVIKINTWIKYAVAASISILAIFFILNTNQDAAPTAEEILADIPDDAIVDYLAFSDLTADEIMDAASFTLSEADSLQTVNPLELTIEEIDVLLEEYSLYDLDSNKL
ncbi:hypothetical protein [Fulvivirga sedimenti]|uniref:Uncharacterized protein n=1 Tax=Fulvivirga sedimenti TaxID=2879465 RepID=A0A9X1KZH6_9BACT|nr:hypothetical protein [Fulvivirga sedimenti]MCA6074701.1 hypothetical protein [Fulvivirga sedimenti]MCA6075878.1 hypothetical protein [Fulvivirga sedimenti]MCA6077006.1 hypothetical protein [Fulvivirga sedimenti]